MYLLKLLRHQSMSGEQLSHTLLLYLVFYRVYVGKFDSQGMFDTSVNKG